MIGIMREIRTTTYMIFMLCCVSLAVIGCNQEADSLLTSQVDNTNNTLAPNTLVPPTISPTATIAPPKETCKNDAMFVTDLTIPDFSKLEPNKPISKLWQIRNTGTCPWGPGYSVVFKEGHAMTTKLQHALYPAKPDANAIIQIDMITPSSPGDYQGYWLLYDPDGIMFGQKLFIKITIEASSSE
ncbi:MAG: NBR1-Ig-like domain-containing protein [Anaerolineales bacterium]|nr:NBR1-Ig-like domain-containing protein [Anaerolineales bacterium]